MAGRHSACARRQPLCSLAGVCAGRRRRTAISTSPAPLIEKSAYDGIPCGKVVRVATHLAPPFIKVDTQKCSAQKCPPEAFGSDGGLTYEFVMNEVRDGLIQICKDRGDTPRVDFEWYLPATDRTNPRSALEMVCQGSFSPGQAAAESQAALVNRCKSGTPAGYKGPSPIGTCRQIGDQSCLSSGPDFAAGALHITPDALQMLSMTAPYYNFKQLTVKRPAEQPDLVTELTKVYAAFSNELWLCIMGEVLLVWLLFLATEPYNDDCLEGGWTLYFDCFYWSFTTSARQRRSTTRSSLTAKTSGLRGDHVNAA